MPAADGPIRVRKKTAPKKAPAAVKPQGVFGGLKPATAPITRAQGQARQKVRKATQKVERNVQVPVTPKLANPTRQQRSAAQTQVAKSLHRQGITTRQQVAALPKSQQKRVHRAEGYARTNTRRNPNFVRDTVKKGDLHSRLHLPGATIDLSPTLATIGQHLHGNPLSAVVRGSKDLMKHGGIGGRLLQDAVDLPANTATSTYLVGKAALTGHPGKAVKMLADPIIHTVEHPVKSFEQHPLNTLLIARGIKGGFGHGAGKVMRSGALGKTAKAAAGTERAAKIVPGTNVEIRRQYSKDPTSKAVQIATEKVKARRAVRKGRPAPTQATARDMQRRVDEDVQAAKIVTQHHQAEAAQQAADAIGYTRKGRRAGKITSKPTAATNLAAQGIVTADRADLENYQRELVGRESKLKTPRERKANAQTQALIQDALKNHDPVSIDRAARAYSAFRQQQEAKLLGHNIIKGGPNAAEAARLEGVRARRVAPGSQATTRVVRRAANKTLKQAATENAQAKAAFATAEADARAARTSRGGIPPKQHDALLRAIDRKDKAQAAYDQAKLAQHEASAAHIRAHMGPDHPEPAFVSQQPIPARSAAIPLNRPRVPISTDRTGQAIRGGTLDAHPAKLVEQAAGTQRLIDAAQARNHTIDQWGYRPRQGQAPKPFKSKKGAELFGAQKLEAQTGIQWEAVKREDGQYSLIPQHAAQRLRAHQDKVTANHPLARAMGAQWRRNVLAFSPRWFFGNQLEGAMRSVVAGAGPTSYLTAKKALKQLTPAERDQALARTVGGGQYNVANAVAHERNITRDAQDLGRMATAVQKLGNTKSVHALSHAYEAYTNVVFRSLNGRLENQFQTAMLGKALRSHPLMSQHTVGLAAKAVQDAANGLRDTNTLVELGRQVDDMYGRYGKFSPGLQEMIANYTPFIAWSLNATNFLYHVLPRDHPVLTGLLASANTATEGQRKALGLYLDVLGKTGGQVPAWLQGSIPGKGDSHLRVSRYTPFGLLDAEGAPVLGGVQSLILPQLSEIVQNAGGKDWMGHDLSKNPSGARDLLAAVASFIEGQVPLASQAANLAGVKTPNMRDTQKIEPSLKVRARKQFDPFVYTASKPATVRKKTTGGVTWGDSGAGVTWGDKSSGVTWGG